MVSETATRFTLNDKQGRVVHKGEEADGIYRVFHNGAYTQFESVELVFQFFPNLTMQPELFESETQVTQLSIF